MACSSARRPAPPACTRVPSMSKRRTAKRTPVLEYPEGPVGFKGADTIRLLGRRLPAPAPVSHDGRHVADLIVHST